MENVILIRSEGNSDVELLEKEILDLKDEFAKEGVEICQEIKKSLEFGAVGGILFITICGTVASGIILKLIDKIFMKNRDLKNTNIQVNIKEINVNFSLPKEKQKLLDYFKTKPDKKSNN